MRDGNRLWGKRRLSWRLQGLRGGHPAWWSGPCMHWAPNSLMMGRAGGSRPMTTHHVLTAGCPSWPGIENDSTHHAKRRRRSGRGDAASCQVPGQPGLVVRRLGWCHYSGLAWVGHPGEAPRPLTRRSYEPQSPPRHLVGSCLFSSLKLGHERWSCAHLLRQRSTAVKLVVPDSSEPRTDI